MLVRHDGSSLNQPFVDALLRRLCATAGIDISVACALDRVRAMAGQPIVPGPGQELLDELVAHALVGAAPSV